MEPTMNGPFSQYWAFFKGALDFNLRDVFLIQIFMDCVPLFPLGLSDTFPGNKELPPLPHKLPGGKTKILLQSFHIQHYLQHIWCLGPCLRTWKINCSFFRACCTVCMAAWCGPCAETCGLYFSKVENRSSWLFTYMPPPIFYRLFHPHYFFEVSLHPLPEIWYSNHP